MIDSHCHLDHIERDPDEVLAEAEAAGVEAVVDIGMGVDASRAAASRAAARPGRLYASVGLHPNDLGGFSDEAMNALRELTASAGVVGIGETGLDFYRNRSSPELQEEAFRAHIALAKQTRRALVIHCRDAHDDVLRILEDAGPPERVVMHCFSGNLVHARACADRGYWCSFAGNLTYKRSDELREAARSLPEELLLVETDAPFLAPHPHRGKPNSPALLPLTAACLAEVRGVSAARLSEISVENTRSVFGLPAAAGR